MFARLHDPVLGFSFLKDVLFLVNFISQKICAFASIGALPAEYARIDEQLANGRRDV